MRKCFSEFLGSFGLVFSGTGAIVIDQVSGGAITHAGVALTFGLAHPATTKSLVIVGCGSGTVNREPFVAAQLARAEELERDGIEALVRNLEALPTRRSFRVKDPRGWEEFIGGVRAHDAVACAHLIRGVIVKRRTIFELERELRDLRVPTLVMTGDQDEPCIEPALFMRRHIPHAGLVVVPMTGHTVNIEEPGLFNAVTGEFLTAVENGRWGTWTA